MINKIKELLNKVEHESNLKDEIIVDLSVKIAKLEHELLHTKRSLNICKNQRDVFHNKVDIRV